MSLTIGVSLQGASKKDFPELVRALVDSAQAAMTKDGFQFGVSGVVIEKAGKGKGKGGERQLRFPSLLTARGFFWKFQEYEWCSLRGSQTIVVMLRHQAFEDELKQAPVRVAAASSKITPNLVQNLLSTSARTLDQVAGHPGLSLVPGSSTLADVQTASRATQRHETTANN